MHSNDKSSSSPNTTSDFVGVTLLIIAAAAGSWAHRQDEIEKHFGLLEQARYNGSLSININLPIARENQTISEVLEALKSSRSPIIIASFSGSDRHGVAFHKDLRVPRERIVKSLQQMDNYYGNVRIVDKGGNVLETENSIPLDKFVQDVCCREQPQAWAARIAQHQAPEPQNRR